mgnify:CR=1 FL=1
MSSEVTGKRSDGAWWQVKIPTAYSADGLAWVSADYVTTANTENVPVAAAPKPPPALPPSAMPSYTIPVLQKSIAVLRLIAEGRGRSI